MSRNGAQTKKKKLLLQARIELAADRWQRSRLPLPHCSSELQLQPISITHQPEYEHVMPQPAHAKDFPPLANDNTSVSPLHSKSHTLLPCYPFPAFTAYVLQISQQSQHATCTKTSLDLLALVRGDSRCPGILRTVQRSTGTRSNEHERDG
jgi:hypothetical protein